MEHNKMRILLTGSSGWLGRHLAPRLRRDGHLVVGLDVAPGPETTVVGSIADRALIDRVFAEHSIDAVVHAGALHKPDVARYAKQSFVDVNVTGTLNLLEAATAATNDGDLRRRRCDRFVFTSTTSLMISDHIREGRGDTAVWIDESMTPLEPRNIYGVTKLSAEHTCRLVNLETSLPIVVLRTSRFFPEDDDTHSDLPGENMKCNELLHRRLTVHDAVEAHVVALERAPAIGFGTFLVSAPTPFSAEDCAALKTDAASVIRRYFPDADGLYAGRGWSLPRSIDRVYDSRRSEQVLGVRYRTKFADVLDALRNDRPLPIDHDPSYTSPALSAKANGHTLSAKAIRP
eukprot:TRINITY_DN27278_c0_g1_i1.p1 TRINITY_DN27278_c0_g1~~TRINITY_DN27278_c0_g1_i1.p1  ORF type:complete len:346 (-),score=139.51 TRINITY_DN27278_c0_g1_i1:310-1347(-)